MTMSTLFSILSVIVGFGLSMAATALLTQALFPGWVARSSQRVSRKPIRTFFVGLALGVVLIGISLVVLQSALQFFGAMLLAATFGIALAGAAGVAQCIGSRLPSPADTDRPWKAIIRGWTVLFLASVAPFLGWFFFLPVALLLGLGAAVLSLFRSRAARSLSCGSDAELIGAPEPVGSVAESQWADRSGVDS